MKIFTKIHLLFIVLLVHSFSSFGQLGINNENPNPYSVLDIKHSKKGVLIPRMTTSEREAMGPSAEAEGLLVYDTDYDMFFYFYDSKWYSLNPWKSEVKLNSNISSNTMGNVGIGTTAAPTEKLEVNGNIKSNGNISSTGNITSTGSLNGSSVNTGNVTATGHIYSTSVNTRTVNASGTVSALKFTGDGIIPAGGIIMWSGTTAPVGWHLCNGEKGTPNLKGQFIVGYDPEDGDYNNPGNRSTGGVNEGTKGGERKHALLLSEMPRHSHGFTDISNSSDKRSGATGDDGNTVANPNESTSNSTTSLTGGDTNSGEGPGLPHENRPPYYVLAYIMKLP